MTAYRPPELPPAPDNKLPVSASSLGFPVVGIGASSGGIQALLRFFENMPSDAGMAFVIVLHLSPTYESHADEIIQRTTKMRVMQVTAPTVIEKNCVYLISPASNLLMMDGSLHVTRAERPHGRPEAIDLFFRSLAEAHGMRAISIVLSDNGSDGAVGISRIKECAGVTIAQSPEDAEYDEMPRSALATGMVDIALPVVDMPQKLIELWNNARVIALPMNEDGESFPMAQAEGEAAEQALLGILNMLQARTGHDFHHYKRATILRRIERRLQVNAIANLPAYLCFLDTHRDETTALLKDFLIGVTNFFRDREAFEAVEREVVPKLLEDRTAGEKIRAWVAGCSTGEEVYSLGMILSEGSTDPLSAPGLQLFATDIDEKAIQFARSAAYPEAILTDVPPARLQRFFTKTRGRYVISKALREKVLFASHNILRDPPFSQLDLISCRNLLIYLDRTVQRQILQTFHFSLRPGAYLFLGSAESAEIAADLFAPVDKKNRIYRARVLSSALQMRALPPVVTQIASIAQFRAAPVAPPRARAAPTHTALHQRVLEHHAPPYVIVDRDTQIVHMSREAGRFLRYVDGEPTHQLLTLINSELRVELRAALFQALQQGRDVDVRQVRFPHGDAHSYVDIAVRPYRNNADDIDVVLVTFTELHPPPSAPDLSGSGAKVFDPLVAQLEGELHLAKEQLQASIEQSSISNEELKASNEELQAIVEEMRSTSEELETGKEELQSVNEELTTVNGELLSKVEETAKANDDLENLLAGTGIATIFVDREMRIQRYSPSAVDLFNLIGSDIGRPLPDLTHRLIYPQLTADATSSFVDLKLIEREVETVEGRWLLARLLPYRTSDDRIDGAVLTLIDITALRQAQREARESEELLKLAAQVTADYAIIVLNADGVIVTWNKAAERVFGYSPDEAVGQLIDLIFLPDERAAGAPLRERQQAAAAGRADDDRWHMRKDGTRIFCRGVVTPIDTDTFKGYAKIARDDTDKKGAESQQELQLTLERAIRTQAEEANRLKDEFFAVLSHELKNPLNLIHVKAELLTRLPAAREIAPVREAADAIQRSVISQAKIIDDLLDLSRVRTGKLALQFEPVDLAAVIRAVVDASFDDASSNGIALSMAGVDLPVVVQADAVRFEQMLWNVVRNALKFTPRGGRIDLSLSRENGFACVDVADSGRGIPSDFLPKVFDMFSQAEGGGRRDRGGLGIGLSLVKQLAEMHGGRIEVASAGLGLGARFRLWLPERDHLLHEKSSAEPIDPSILKGMKILLVDDALDGLEAFCTLLKLEGALVQTATSGESALSTASKEDFDVILSDIGMPEMNGYELIAQMRKSPRTARVPAIALTGFGREQDIAKAMEAGFDAHISKPVSLRALLDAIGRRVARSS
jgi:two-component system CheB/CheR fusion protein